MTNLVLEKLVPASSGVHVPCYSTSNIRDNRHMYESDLSVLMSNIFVLSLPERRPTKVANSSAPQ